MPGFAIDSPRYLEPTQDTDSLFRMLLELASEVWVLRDRLTLVERTLDEKGCLTRSDLDSAEPGPAAEAELAKERAQFVERLISSAHRADA
ncbi:hypothetical protein [Microbacterium hatanonis]|uniref:Uncharacterized protein n=1 Tax=Microbacterium hatanonis TaxID=404366 RepID=A0A5C8I0I7_9MICO|nr:hypothetical protein [Microbacterium hatanonis]TXK12472.1 hypothetical protein FVP77_03060 [Microbacterium hatanonis]